MLRGIEVSHESFELSRADNSSADGGIVVPDAHLLFNAEFKRVGNDLRLIGDDGGTFVISNYFSGKKQVALLSPDGAAITPENVRLLAGADFEKYAQASPSAPTARQIGSVAKVEGNVTAVRNGVAVILNVGDNVLKGDVVQTGSNSALGLTFADGSVFSLSANARMVLNEFVYDPGGTANNAAFSLIQGGIDFLAGRVAKTGDMRVSTPVATLGIRGTAVHTVTALDGTLRAYVIDQDQNDHIVELFDLNGNLRGTLHSKGGGIQISPSGNQISLLEIVKSDAQKQLEGGVFQSLLSIGGITQDPNTDPDTRDILRKGTQFIPSDQGRLAVLDSMGGTGSVGGITTPASELSLKLLPPAEPIFPDSDEPVVVNGTFAMATLPEFANTAGSHEHHHVSSSFPDVNDTVNVSLVSVSVSSGRPISEETSAALQSALTATLNNGSLQWVFDIEDRLADFLAAGQNLTLTYQLTESGPYQVTVILQGMNDVPVVNPIAEPHRYEQTTTADLVADIPVTFTDIDLIDIGHAASIQSVTLIGAVPPGVTSGQSFSSGLFYSLLAAGAVTKAFGSIDGSVTLTFTAASTVFDYLRAGQEVTLTYTIAVDDHDGGVGTQAVTVVIVGTNDTPALSATLTSKTYTDTAADDTFAAVSGTLSTIDRDAGDSANYSIGGASTDVSLAGYDLSKGSTYGTLYLNSATGAYTFIPNDGAIEGLKTIQTVDFTLVVTDGSGATDSQPFTVTLNGANDTPVLAAVTGPTYTDTAIDNTFTAATGTLSGSDRDNDTLTYGITGGTTGGSTVLGSVSYDVSKVGAYGTLYVNSTTGQYRFEPSDSAIEALETITTEGFTVTTSDGTALVGQPFTVTLNDTNDTPVLAAVTGPTYTDTAIDNTFTAATGTLSGSDRDNDTLTYGITGGTTGGSTVLGSVSYDVSKVGSYGTLYVNSTTGQYRFEPSDPAIEALKTNTTEGFTVTTSDGTALVGQPFTVTLNGANDTPVLAAVTGPTYTDTAIDNTFTAATGTLSGSDRDNDTLTYGITGGTIGGSTVLGSVSYDVSKVGSYGTLYVNSTTGQYRFEPSDPAIEALKTNTTEGFTVTTSDGTALVGQPFTVTLNGANDTPVLAAVTGPTYTDTSIDNTFTAATGTLSGSDRDNDTLTYGITGGTTGGSTVLGSVSYDVSKVGSYGTLYVNSTTGQYRFEPSDPAIEALETNTTEGFTVTTSDGTALVGQPFTVTLNGANDTPVLAAVTGPTYTDTAIDNTFTAATGTLSGSDRDNDTLTYGITGGTIGGSTVLGSVSYDVSKVGSYGTLYVNSTTGQYRFEPSDPAIEALKANTTEGFTVTTSDGTALVGQPFTVTLNGANDTPVLAAVTGPTYPDTAIDNTFTAATGTLSGSDRDNDTLTYGITGGTTGGSTVLGSVSYDVSKVGSYGTLYVNSTTGQYRFEPSDPAIEALKANTTEGFTVTTSDGTALVGQPFTVTLNGANDTPVLAAVTGPTYPDTSGDNTFTAATGTLSGSDRDNDTLTYGITGGTTGGSTVLGSVSYDVSKVGSYGTLYVNSTTGQYRFEPSDPAIEALKANTTEGFTVTTSDGTALVGQPFTVTLNGANDQPDITVVSGNSDHVTLTETNAGLAASGTVTVTDLDVTDVVTGSVFSVVASGQTGGLNLDYATLLGFLSVGPSPVIDSSRTIGQLTWSFNSGSYAFDYLGAGEKLTLTYTIKATDDSGMPATNSDNQTITIVINGTFDDVDGPDGVNFNIATGDFTASTNTGNLKAGDIVGSFAAFGDTDPVGGDTFTYTLGGQSDSHFTLSSNGTLSVASNTGTGSYVVSVIAQDAAGNQSGATAYTIWVGTNSNNDPTATDFSASPNAVIAFGVNGAENLIGSRFDDALSGAKNDDRLNGGAGNDTLVGGEGSDTFVFTPNFGHDKVLDFTSGQDVIELSSSIFADFDALLAHATATSDGVLITADPNNTILLQNVATTAALQQSDFHFVI